MFKVDWTCPRCSMRHQWEWCDDDIVREGNYYSLLCEDGCEELSRMLYAGEEEGWVPTWCQCLSFHREDTDEHEDRCSEWLRRNG